MMVSCLFLHRSSCCRASPRPWDDPDPQLRSFVHQLLVGPRPQTRATPQQSKHLDLQLVLLRPRVALHQCLAYLRPRRRLRQGVRPRHFDLPPARPRRILRVPRTPVDNIMDRFRLVGRAAVELYVPSGVLGQNRLVDPRRAHFGRVLGDLVSVGAPARGGSTRGRFFLLLLPTRRLRVASRARVRVVCVPRFVPDALQPRPRVFDRVLLVALVAVRRAGPARKDPHVRARVERQVQLSPRRVPGIVRRRLGVLRVQEAAGGGEADGVGCGVAGEGKVGGGLAEGGAAPEARAVDRRGRVQGRRRRR